MREFEVSCKAALQVASPTPDQLVSKTTAEAAPGGSAANCGGFAHFRICSTGLRSSAVTSTREAWAWVGCALGPFIDRDPARPMDRRRNSAAAVTVNLLRCPRRNWAPPSQQIGRSQNFVVAQLSALAADPIPLLWHQEGPQCSHHLNQPTECQAISTRSRSIAPGVCHSAGCPRAHLEHVGAGLLALDDDLGLGARRPLPAPSGRGDQRDAARPRNSTIVPRAACRRMLTSKLLRRHHATVRARPNVVWSPAQASPARALSRSMPGRGLRVSARWLLSSGMLTQGRHGWR
jgi:hypothetical protein